MALNYKTQSKMANNENKLGNLVTSNFQPAPCIAEYLPNGSSIIMRLAQILVTRLARW
jgi:hypothetical protein